MKILTILLAAAQPAPLITIPGDILQAPQGEANYCYNDATGAAVCEYRPPAQAEPKPAPPAGVPSKQQKKQRG